MSPTDARIRDFVEARAQPTVVRLQDLESEQAEWLSECFVLTADVRGHLEVRGAAQGTDASGISQVMRSASTEACLMAPDGTSEPVHRIDAKTALADWLQNLALRVLRRSYPGFERYAPAHGPLPKEAWLCFVRFAAREGGGRQGVD